MAFVVGDKVMIYSCEGFGGPATVVALRDSPGGRYRVEMDDNNPPPFWAHDSEVKCHPEGRYDSEPDTMEHIGKVGYLLCHVADQLQDRAEVHDQSKLESPEKEYFDKYTPELAKVDFGTPEYRAMLEKLRPAIDHHNSVNRHHPEHFPDGIKGMSLVDLVEMLCDWKAATERSPNGDISRSIEIGQARFGYGDELKAILFNTLENLT